MKKEFFLFVLSGLMLTACFPQVHVLDINGERSVYPNQNDFFLEPQVFSSVGSVQWTGQVWHLQMKSPFTTVYMRIRNTWEEACRQLTYQPLVHANQINPGFYSPAPLKYGQPLSLSLGKRPSYLSKTEITIDVYLNSGVEACNYHTTLIWLPE